MAVLCETQATNGEAEVEAYHATDFLVCRSMSSFHSAPLPEIGLKPPRVDADVLPFFKPEDCSSGSKCIAAFRNSAV
jgi:hypothetical protein